MQLVPLSDPAFALQGRGSFTQESGRCSGADSTVVSCLQVLEELLGAGVPSDHRLQEGTDEADGAATAHASLAAPELLTSGLAEFEARGMPAFVVTMEWHFLGNRLLLLNCCW